MAHHFKTHYWTSDHSSKVNFQSNTSLPAEESVSACFVFALHDHGVIMSKSHRGWEFPGGHREHGETAEACVRREALEEASIELKNLELVGRWKIEKQFHSASNAKYPDLAYQLLYIANVAKLQLFSSEHETSARAVVPLDKVASYHHSFDDFKDVFRYIIDTKDLAV